MHNDRKKGIREDGKEKVEGNRVMEDRLTCLWLGLKIHSKNLFSVV